MQRHQCSSKLLKAGKQSNVIEYGPFSSNSRPKLMLLKAKDVILAPTALNLIKFSVGKRKCEL